MIHGKLYKTRFTEIGFTLNSPGDWRFVDLTDSLAGEKDTMHVIGASYATKAELLASVERYAAEYGCEGAIKPAARLELLETFFREIVRLTVNHEELIGSAVVYPSALGDALAKVDPKWYNNRL